MSTSVVFVHGTGVRKAGYEKAFARVREGVASSLPSARVVPCLWGESEGCRLAHDGRSIPEFSGVSSPVPGDAELAALWELLSVDPLFEIRELTGIVRHDGLRTEAARHFSHQITQLGAVQEAIAMLPFIGDEQLRATQWNGACLAVASSDAIAGLMHSIRWVDGPLRIAVARACIASWQYQNSGSGCEVVTKDVRDELTALLTDCLGGIDKAGAVDWIKRRFKGSLLRWVTDKARRERDVLCNGAYPGAGDILLYQRDGQHIRDFIAAKIDECDGDVVVIAHSLGGIATAELLISQPRPSVRALVTVGSQVGLLYELGALYAIKSPDKLPSGFPKKWLNFFDRDDLLSYLVAPFFSQAQDIEMRSGQPFPYAHSAYWNQPAVWSRIGRELG